VEVEKLQASGKVGRHGTCNRTPILLAYRHGLRVSDLMTMRWEQIDWSFTYVVVSLWLAGSNAIIFMLSGSR